MLIKLQKSQVHHIIIQKQLQTNMANKYLKKDIYISPKEKQKIIDDLRLIYSIIMEHQKIMNLLDNTPHHPSKIKTENSVVINDESRGMQNKGNQIRFKTSMLRSSLCDQSDAYILAKVTTTVTNTAAQVQPSTTANEKLMFKNCAPFTNCISRINTTRIDDAHVILMQ